MRNPLQITYHDFRHNPQLDTVINEKFDKILAEGLDVTKCHVTIEKLSKHHQKGYMICTRLDLKIAHFEDILLKEHCLETTASIKSALLKIFKQSLDLARKHKKRRLDHKRVAVSDAISIVEEELE